MTSQVKELAAKVGTDVSGKWLAVDKIDQLTELIIQECVANLFLNGYDDAANQLTKHFELE